MTVELGRLKRGDDKTFRAIVVTVDGVPQNLTAEGWSVRAHFRPYVAADDAVEPAIDAAELVDSRIVLSLTRTQSADMESRTWVGDAEVTGPDGRQSSATFDVVVEADVTR